MKLSKWAKSKGIHYNTALKWFHDGRIPNAHQLDTGTILVDENVNVNQAGPICLYARVSSQSRRKEIKYQVDRLSQFALGKGVQVDKIYSEVASGMNDKRPKLWKMIDSNPSMIIVENKDRLTRFGFEYLERLLNRLGCEVVVINRDSEDESDLMKDLVAIITSFCCRLYGLRRGQNKAKTLKDELAK